MHTRSLILRYNSLLLFVIIIHCYSLYIFSIIIDIIIIALFIRNHLYYSLLLCIITLLHALCMIPCTQACSLYIYSGCTCMQTCRWWWCLLIDTCTHTQSVHACTPACLHESCTMHTRSLYSSPVLLLATNSLEVLTLRVHKHAACTHNHARTLRVYTHARLHTCTNHVQCICCSLA
jgi:hypothetical protein